MNTTSHPQVPPWALQIEPTEGCNLRCSFCGIRGIRESTGDRDNLSGPYRFMSPATATALAKQVAAAPAWNPRLEIAMHGEPTMNPHLPRIISALRRYLPKQPIMITTNGIPLLPSWKGALRELYEAGANTIAVDDYRPHKAREAVLGTKLPGVTVHRYPEDGTTANPHRRPKRTEPNRLILVKDISQAETGNHSTLSNHAGAAGPPDDRYDNERCAVPFRELAIRWDGSIALCCNDWRGTYKIGNIHKHPVHELWQHPRFQAARRRLLTGTRDFAPCQGCTHRTQRNGLLPDGTGGNKAPLGPPHPDDEHHRQAAVAGEPITVPIARKWEVNP